MNAKLLKSEYRGQRIETAIVEYVRQLLTDSVINLVFDDWHKFNTELDSNHAIIGYFREVPEQHLKYDMFRRTAADLKAYCKFFWVTNNPNLSQDKNESISFKSAKKADYIEYPSILQNYHELSAWSTIHCIPIVREINFQNAEEITEEGLPLVILFHDSKDQQSIDLFKKIVQNQFINETSNVNFVTADAELFEHPLSHLHKTKKDVPLIAIDSFKHMYLFPSFEDFNKREIFHKFIEDLKSGKLHREYHFGPDESDNENNNQENDQSDNEKNDVTNEVRDDASDESKDDKISSTVGYVNEIRSSAVLTPVADSIFKELAPSSYRYTFKRDEL